MSTGAQLADGEELSGWVFKELSCVEGAADEAVSFRGLPRFFPSKFALISPEIWSNEAAETEEGPEDPEDTDGEAEVEEEESKHGSPDFCESVDRVFAVRDA